MAKTSQNRLACSLYSLAANSKNRFGFSLWLFDFVYCCWNEGQAIAHYEWNAQLQRHSASCFGMLEKKQTSKHNLLWGPSFPFHQVFYFTLRVEKSRRKQVNYGSKYGYSTRCNPSTDQTLQPKSLFPITLFSKHCHFLIQLYLFLQKFGTQECLSMLVLPSAWSIALRKACRKNTKTREQDQTILTFTGKPTRSQHT